MKNIKLKITMTEDINVSPKDIDFAEYRTYWGPKQFPAIKVYMKDKTIYTVGYADEFRTLITQFKKHDIKVLDLNVVYKKTDGRKIKNEI